MRAYIIRRALLTIPTFIIITFVIFLLTDLMPGDAIDAFLAHGAGDVEIDRDELARSLGLDAPLPARYARWMGVLPQPDGNYRGFLQGDFGTSWFRGTPIVEDIATRWPVTLQLSLMALLVTQLIALPVGIVSALEQDRWPDYLGRTLAIGLISLPGFWVATMVIVFPSIWWGYMPSMRLIRLFEDPIGNLKMFIIPAIVMGMGMGGMVMRMTRTMMLEVLRQDYIRTAWSKGLRQRVIVLRHALKNALIPVITVIGFQLPVLIGGSVIIEQIFMLPGMGRLLIGASMQRDQPVVSGVLFFFAMFLVLINLLIDLTYAYLDPRVHYK